jgi:hypothetical protein
MCTAYSIVSYPWKKGATLYSPRLIIVPSTLPLLYVCLAIFMVLLQFAQSLRSPCQRLSHRRYSHMAVMHAASRPSIAIVGAGAIGCYYGARLWESGQFDVRFYMRGEHRDVSAAQGLQIKVGIGCSTHDLYSSGVFYCMLEAMTSCLSSYKQYSRI